MSSASKSGSLFGSLFQSSGGAPDGGLAGAIENEISDVAHRVGQDLHQVYDRGLQQVEARASQAVHNFVDPIRREVQREVSRVKVWGWVLFAMVAVTLALVVLNLAWTNKMYKAICPPVPRYAQPPLPEACLPGQPSPIAPVSVPLVQVPCPSLPLQQQQQAQAQQHAALQQAQVQQQLQLQQHQAQQQLQAATQQQQLKFGGYSVDASATAVVPPPNPFAACAAGAY